MSRSIVHWSEPTEPVARLVCIAHAGAGAARFRPWAAALPDDVALWGVRLAGRESRACEPPPRDLDAVVVELLSALEQVNDGAAVALFGHCSGAYIAFALAQALVAQGTPPMRLFLAGQGVPGGYEEDEPLDPRALAEQQFGGTVDDDLAELLVAAIQADLELIEGMESRVGDVPLAAPITAVVGTEDPLPRERVAAWADRTSAEFALLELPGGHFIDESWERLAELVGQSIRHSCQVKN